MLGRRSKLRLYGYTVATRATAYITTPLRCIIRLSVAVSPIKPAGRDHFQDVLGDVCPGQPITREAALALMACNNEDVPELLVVARAAKERFKPRAITYSRKVFLPLTNLCRDYCGYCTFRRDPGRSDVPCGACHDARARLEMAQSHKDPAALGRTAKFAQRSRDHQRGATRSRPSPHGRE